MTLCQPQGRGTVAIGDVHIRPGVDERFQAGDMVGTAVAEHDGFDQRRPVQIIHMIQRCAGGNQRPDHFDMSEMGKFLAFQAAVALCKERGMADLLREVYGDCVAQAKKPTKEMRNHVKRIYDAFTEEEIAAKAAELVYPAKSGWKGELVLVFQKIASLHKACPSSRGDWYFTGDYPTPGGNRVVNRAFMNFYEGKDARAY